MRSAPRAALLLVVVLVGGLTAACSSESVPDDRFGDCKVGPGASCTDDDLRNISLVAADLRGIDFSGSNLSSADLRDSDLTGAKFVGATLAGTNFAGATLKDADLTNALMFGTNLTDADLAGAVTTGVQRCQVTEVDGSYTPGQLLDAEGNPVPCSNTGSGTNVLPTPGATGAGGPPEVAYFRPAKPERCINDVAGSGIDVQWSTPNATSVNFYVDGIRIQSSTKKKGTVRLPFICDGETHIVGLQAYGAAPRPAEASFTAALDNAEPLNADSDVG